MADQLAARLASVQAALEALDARAASAREAAAASEAATAAARATKAVLVARAEAAARRLVAVRAAHTSASAAVRAAEVEMEEEAGFEAGLEVRVSARGREREGWMKERKKLIFFHSIGHHRRHPRRKLGPSPGVHRGSGRASG